MLPSNILLARMQAGLLPVANRSRPTVSQIASMTMLTGIPTGKGAGSVTEGSSRAVWLQQARSYLRNADPVLARLIDDRPAFDPRAWMAELPPMDLYGALLFQVTGQQLSVAATRRTLARIQALFDGHLPSPTELLGVDPG